MKAQLSDLEAYLGELVEKYPNIEQLTITLLEDYYDNLDITGTGWHKGKELRMAELIDAYDFPEFPKLTDHFRKRLDLHAQAIEFGLKRAKSK